MSTSKQITLNWEDFAPERAWTRQSESRPVRKTVVFLVDYGMVSHGLAPLFVDGHATELGFWGLSSDIIRRLTRLNELYDRQVNWDNPNDPTWRISERDRNEFNALLPFLASELQIALGDRWELVVESQPL
ncbi:MAG: hypothetical protein ACO1OG_07125 [Devosia sp.]